MRTVSTFGQQCEIITDAAVFVRIMAIYVFDNIR